MNETTSSEVSNCSLLSVVADWLHMSSSSESKWSECGSKKSRLSVDNDRGKTGRTMRKGSGSGAGTRFVKIPDSAKV